MCPPCGCWPAPAATTSSPGSRPLPHCSTR
ncbi:EspF repeat-containing protein [Streptomyces sp. NPDC059787]